MKERKAQKGAEFTYLCARGHRLTVLYRSMEMAPLFLPCPGCKYFMRREDRRGKKGEQG